MIAYLRHGRVVRTGASEPHRAPTGTRRPAADSDPFLKMNPGGFHVCVSVGLPTLHRTVAASTFVRLSGSITINQTNQINKKTYEEW